MTTNLSDFSLTFLGTIKSRLDVNVNIDVTITTYFWQPSFSKCAFKKKRFYLIIYYLNYYIEISSDSIKTVTTVARFIPIIRRLIHLIVSIS